MEMTVGATVLYWIVKAMLAIVVGYHFIACGVKMERVTHHVTNMNTHMAKQASVSVKKHLAMGAVLAALLILMDHSFLGWLISLF